MVTLTTSRFLNQINQALVHRHSSILVRYNKFIILLLEVFQQIGFVDFFRILSIDVIYIQIKYSGGSPAFSHLNVLSSSTKSVYLSHNQILEKEKKNKVLIFSTNKGLSYTHVLSNASPERCFRYKKEVKNFSISKNFLLFQGRITNNNTFFFLNKALFLFFSTLRGLKKWFHILMRGSFNYKKIEFVRVPVNTLLFIFFKFFIFNLKRLLMFRLKVFKLLTKARFSLFFRKLWVFKNILKHITRRRRLRTRIYLKFFRRKYSKKKFLRQLRKLILFFYFSRFLNSKSILILLNNLLWSYNSTSLSKESLKPSNLGGKAFVEFTF